jgi:hypothetical protein
MFEKIKADEKTIKIMQLADSLNLVTLAQNEIVETFKNCFKATQYKFPSGNFDYGPCSSMTFITLRDSEGKPLKPYSLNISSKQAIKEFREIENIILPELNDLQIELNNIVETKNKIIKDRIVEIANKQKDRLDF